MSCTDYQPVLPVSDPLIDPMVPMHYEAATVNIPTAVGILVVATTFTYFTADGMVSSLNGMVEHSDVSKEWITLIIIPIVSNAVELTTAVVVAHKGKFDLCTSSFRAIMFVLIVGFPDSAVMSVTVGSCIQIALFVIPFLIIIAWALGKPLTLLFDPIETMVRNYPATSAVIDSD